uniref:Uncharacterized protein n=1 Tax=Anguilla anguilla TaxID=7936 RepID=A0A0E9SGE7_ANGAN
MPQSLFRPFRSKSYSKWQILCLDLFWTCVFPYHAHFCGPTSSPLTADSNSPRPSR